MRGYVFQPRRMSWCCWARSSIRSSSSSRKRGVSPGLRRPLKPRFGITNECMTVRCEVARALTVAIVCAASAIGRGWRVSSPVGTHDSTVIVIAESRNSSLR